MMESAKPACKRGSQHGIRENEREIERTC